MSQWQRASRQYRAEQLPRRVMPASHWLLRIQRHAARYLRHFCRTCHHEARGAGVIQETETVQKAGLLRFARNHKLMDFFSAALCEHARKGLVLLIGSGLVMTCMTGCNTASGHKVLTFFFTGVPPLGEKEKPEEETKAVAAASRQRAVVVKATLYSHGPYAANECYRCHEVSASGGFRGFGKKEEAAGALAKPGIVPGKMVAPLVELCTGCHDTKSPLRATNKGLWVHGPVGAGYCIACHAPHAGPEPYMLLKKPDALCVECHAEGTVFNRAVHKDKRDCTSCHNPHLGKDSRLLKADFREAW